MFFKTLFYREEYNECIGETSVFHCVEYEECDITHFPCMTLGSPTPGWQEAQSPLMTLCFIIVGTPW